LAPAKDIPEAAETVTAATARLLSRGTLYSIPNVAMERAFDSLQMGNGNVGFLL